jgi:hypothetical protein
MPQFWPHLSTLVGVRGSVTLHRARLDIGPANRRGPRSADLESG